MDVFFGGGDGHGVVGVTDSFLPFFIANRPLAS